MYCLGFKSNLDNEAITYYIDDKLDFHDLVFKLIGELVRPKYKDITFYAHNLGGYDIVFILKVLYDYNDSLSTCLPKGGW
jgi:hypothetical protein